MIRAKCVQRLRDDPSPESKTCLAAYLDDPDTQKQLEGMKDEEPTPEQEVILDAENALRAKARLDKTRAAALLPPPPAPTATGNPFDSPKMKELKGPGPVPPSSASADPSTVK